MKYPEIGSTVYEICRRHLCADDDCVICSLSALSDVKCPSHLLTLEVHPTLFTNIDKPFFGVTIFATQEEAEAAREKYISEVCRL